MKTHKFSLLYVLLFFLFLDFLFCFSFLKSGNNLGIDDWDMHFAYLESARKSVIEFHQFPWWNPYHCGGMVNFGNPQSNIISLTFVFVLLFGTIQGIKISLFLHFYILILGLYFLSRYFKISETGSVAAAVICAFGGTYSSALGAGMLPFLAFAYVPFALLFYLKSLECEKTVISIAVTSCIIAAIFYSSHHILLIMAPTFLITFFYYFLKNEKKRAIFSSLLIIVISTLLASPKLYLSYKFLSEYPRPIYEISGYTLKVFFFSLLSRMQNYQTSAYVHLGEFNLSEKSLYFGYIGLMCFLIGVLKGAKKNLWWIAILALSALLMLGNKYPIGVYNLLKYVPVYNFFRVAERFRFNFIIFVSLFAGLGWDTVFANLSRSVAKNILRFSILAILFIDVATFSNNAFLAKSFIIQNPERTNNPNKKDAFVQSTKLSVLYTARHPSDSYLLKQKFNKWNAYLPWGTEYLAIRNNQGTTECYESTPVSRNAIPVESKAYKGEYFTEPRGRVIHLMYWSPNEIILHIGKGNTNSVLVVNQNYDDGWWVTIDGKTQKAQKFQNLLSSTIRAQEQSVTFFYSPLKLL